VLSLAIVPLAASVQAQTTSTAQNPTVTFSSIGTQSVTLKACNATGCTTVTKNVTVLDPAPHIVSLTTPPPLAGIGLPITLQDTSTGRPTLTHQWVFSSSLLPDIMVPGDPATWTPLVPGNYQAHLEVSNGDGVAKSTPVPVQVVTFTFADVPPTYWAWHFIEGLNAAGVPTDCGTNPLRFCPDNPMTRGDMAIFLLRSKEGGSYAPPPCTTAVFTDVPCSNPLAPWINELVRRGVTAGCGGGNYCPNNSVTRDQMAVFLLVTAGISPDPTCPPAPFTDVPCSTPFEPFIKELVTLGVTAGCGTGTYCPGTTVTRAQMSVFLSVMFHIPTV
jgi:PKD repeat protein